MDKSELLDLVQKLDKNLKLTTRLHIRGGSACMLHGEEYRATIDIDTIPGESHYDKEDLEQACHKAGILLDPTSFEDLESGKPYLQILPEETLILPKPKPNSHLTPWSGEKLSMTTPPPADLIISKIKRCDVVDIQDIAFLMLKFEVKAEELQESFERLPTYWKEDVILKENFENTMRDFFDRFEEPTHKKPCPPTPQKKLKKESPFNLELGIA